MQSCQLKKGHTAHHSRMYAGTLKLEPAEGSGAAAAPPADDAHCTLCLLFCSAPAVNGCTTGRLCRTTDAGQCTSTTALLLGPAATLEQQNRRTCFCRGWLIASVSVVAGFTRTRGLHAASGLLLWWAAVHVAVLLRDRSILPADLH
jgi:hypothetical protein